MPTVNPRVNVTLSPSLSDLVSALARSQRVSRSQVLRELLEAAEPGLQRVVKMTEAAERAKGAMKAGFAENLLRSQMVLEEELQKQLALVDGVAADLVTMAQRIEGRRPGRPSAPRGAGPGGAGAAGGPGGNPPASNRGVKSPKTTTQTPTTGPKTRASAASRTPPKGGMQ